MVEKKAKPQEPAGYCTTAVLANLFDITSQWVGELTKNGILRKHDTEVGPRYNVVEATRAYIKHLREKAAGRGDKDDDVVEKETQKLAAEVRIKEAKAKYAELELQELQGQMHRSEDVEAMTADLIYTIRGSLLALPGRLAVDVSAVRTPAEAAEVIRKEIALLMQELSQYQYDPKKYEERVRKRLDWDTDIGMGGSEDD